MLSLGSDPEAPNRGGLRLTAACACHDSCLHTCIDQMAVRPGIPFGLHVHIECSPSQRTMVAVSFAQPPAPPIQPSVPDHIRSTAANSTS